MREMEGSGEPERRAACGGVVIANGADSECRCRVGNSGQVRLVDTGVANRLVLYEGAVTEHVSEEDHVLIRPRRAAFRSGDVARDGETRARRELTQRLPPVVRQERVI